MKRIITFSIGISLCIAQQCINGIASHQGHSSPLEVPYPHGMREDLMQANYNDGRRGVYGSYHPRYGTRASELTHHKPPDDTY